MKKLIIAMFMLSVFGQMHAQVPTDTIYNRHDKYYYTNWYDDCEYYKGDGRIDSCYSNRADLNGVYSRIGKWNHTPQPLKVKGLAALVDPLCFGARFRSDSRVAEYMYLYQLDTTTPICTWSYEIPVILLDSVRFDTAMPKRMMLPRYENDTMPLSCWVYEGYFKSPAVVDSDFYIFSSWNNNENDGGIYFLKPFIYVSIQNYHFNTCEGNIHYYPEGCPKEYCHDLKYLFGRIQTKSGSDYLGVFLPIVDQYHVDVLSADSLTGSVSGGGLIPDGWVDTLRALPAAGYEFTHWNDGNTDNPRLITVEHDSTFTAYFERTDRTYTVSLDVNFPAWGSVEGGGTYPVYSQVEIRAVPASDAFAFVGWSDGNWDNPRAVTLTQDTSFTATFQQVIAVDEADDVNHVALMPNPASGEVKVDVGVDGRCRIEFIDMAGRLRYARNFNGPAADIDISRLTAGTWLVKVSTPTGTTIRRLVVK